MTRLTIGLATLIVASAFSAAQPPGDGPPPPDGPPAWQWDRSPLGPMLVVETLDVDGDGVISAEEIANAPESLAKLDRNGDGELRRNEWMPRAPRGGRGGAAFPGAPGGRRGQAGDQPRPGRGRFGDWDRPPGEGPAEDATPRRRGENFGGAVPGGRLVERVMQFDEDGDGKLNPDEIPERLLPLLERGDANEDGLIDREELQQIADEIRTRFQEGRGPQRPQRPANAEAPRTEEP